jgi:hypothetical protein
MLHDASCFMLRLRALRAPEAWRSAVSAFETHSVYGSKDDGIPRLCIKHKGAHHVNVVTKLCRHEGCDILPSYGSKKDGEKLFCVEHKHTDHVDLASKRCQHEGCEHERLRDWTYIRQQGRQHSDLLQQAQAALAV